MIFFRGFGWFTATSGLGESGLIAMPSRHKNLATISIGLVLNTVIFYRYCYRLAYVIHRDRVHLSRSSSNRD